MDELYVLGIGPRGLDEAAKEIVASCDVVIASKRQMDRVEIEEFFFNISP